VRTPFYWYSDTEFFHIRGICGRRYRLTVGTCRVSNVVAAQLEERLTSRYSILLEAHRAGRARWPP